MLRLGSGSKRKKVVIPHDTYEISTTLPETQNETEELENELFGDIEQQFEKKIPLRSNDEPLFVIDRGGKRGAVWSDDDECDVSLGKSNITKKFKSADSNRDTISSRQLEDKLRSQFKKIHGTPAWTTRAQTTQSATLASTGHMTQPSKSLPTKKLSVTRCKNLNACKGAKCVVKSLEFHPAASVGFVTGYSKSLNLFEVDGENNKHLHRHHFANFPIDCAKFTSDGNEIVLGSKRPHFYTFDLNKCTATKMAGIRNRPNVHYKNFVLSSNGEYLGFEGQEGLFAVFSARDKQLVKCFNHRSRINCSSFVTDNVILTAGQGGFCTLWDNRTWKPISDFQDEGSLHVTSVTHSSRHIAVGSDSGVVNIYNKDDIYKSSCKPLRAVMNLTTEVNKSTFNSTGELLAISSKEMKHSLRLVNLHTMQCVPNWPTSNTPLAHVTALHFSPNSGYIGIGTTKGKALLYRLTHYPSF